MVQKFLETIVTCLSTLVSNFGQSIATAITGLFSDGSDGLSNAGLLLAMGVGIACAIGLVRIAWNFFANLGHR